jgi:hypothetical protein
MRELLSMPLRIQVVWAGVIIALNVGAVLIAWWQSRRD